MQADLLTVPTEHCVCLTSTQIRPVHLACFSFMNMQNRAFLPECSKCWKVHRFIQHTQYDLLSLKTIAVTVGFFFWLFCFPSALSTFERRVLISAASNTDGYSYCSHDWRIGDTRYLIQSCLFRGHFFSYSRETLNEVSHHRRTRRTLPLAWSHHSAPPYLLFCFTCHFFCVLPQHCHLLLTASVVLLVYSKHWLSCR